MLSAAHVELPVSLLTPPNAQNNPNTASTSQPSAAPITAKRENKKKHHLTTSTDPLYAELRDLNFSAVGKKLSKVAHRLDENYKVWSLSTSRATFNHLLVLDESAIKDSSTAARFCW